MPGRSPRGLGPQTLVEAPAAWTVPVAAGVEGVVLGSTAVADRAVAQPAGAARHDVSGGLALLVIEIQTAHVIAKDVRDTEPLLAAGHVTAWAFWSFSQSPSPRTGSCRSCAPSSLALAEGPRTDGSVQIVAPPLISGCSPDPRDERRVSHRDRRVGRPEGCRERKEASARPFARQPRFWSMRCRLPFVTQTTPLRNLAFSRSG
jgi:hypothetical protein